MVSRLVRYTSVSHLSPIILVIHHWCPYSGCNGKRMHAWTTLSHLSDLSALHQDLPHPTSTENTMILRETLQLQYVHVQNDGFSQEKQTILREENLKWSSHPHPIEIPMVGAWPPSPGPSHPAAPCPWRTARRRTMRRPGGAAGMEMFEMIMGNQPTIRICVSMCIYIYIYTSPLKFPLGFGGPWGPYKLEVMGPFYREIRSNTLPFYSKPPQRPLKVLDRYFL